MKSLKSVWIILMCLFGTMGLSSSVLAYDLEVDDPDDGETWVFDTATNETPSGLSTTGHMRSTTLLGSVREREFRIETKGSSEREDRLVKFYRREPECEELSKLAGINSEDFCDIIEWRADERQIDIAFHSYDANRKYKFRLFADSTTPGIWRSQAMSAALEPELVLNINARDGVVSQYWHLQGTVNEGYSQSTVLLERDLNNMGLSNLEAGLIALSEVLNDFNRFEFTLDALGPRHPDYAPSPYSVWSEGAIDGGCVGIFCFGDIGGGNLGGSGDPNDPCDPRSNNYTPAQCPWDLTYATWPLSLRVKIWKPANHDDKKFSFSMALTNKGPGEFRYQSFLSNYNLPKKMVYTSLKRLGSTQPIIDFETSEAVTNSYDPIPGGFSTLTCQRTHSFGIPFDNSGAPLWPFSNPMPMDVSIPIINSSIHSVLCEEHPLRPKGRYRLYLHIDPSATYDHETKRSNNIGTSGPVDWIRFK